MVSTAIVQSGWVCGACGCWVNAVFHNCYPAILHVGGANGYQCRDCGQWVFAQQMHHCSIVAPR